MIKEIQLRVNLIEERKEGILKYKASKQLGVDKNEITAIKVLRKSIDARKKNIIFNYKVAVYINEQISKKLTYTFDYKDVSNAKEIHIIGFGPAGMYAALRCIELGYKPAKWIGEAIEEANKRNLSGDTLKSFIDEIKPLPPIEPQTGLKYHKNIRAEHKEEVLNVQQVFETMDVLMQTPTIINGSVMPDACPTGEKGQIPVGGVVGAKNAIHPSMHSADICCSVMMTNFGKTLLRIIISQQLMSLNLMTLMPKLTLR